jgi:hypothetical protein
VLRNFAAQIAAAKAEGSASPSYARRDLRLAARERAAKAEALREAAEEWPKMRGSHTRSDVAQWLRERADREAP